MPSIAMPSGNIIIVVIKIVNTMIVFVPSVSIMYGCPYADCHYTECRFAECRGADCPPTSTATTAAATTAAATARFRVQRIKKYLVALIVTATKKTLSTILQVYQKKICNEENEGKMYLHCCHRHLRIYRLLKGTYRLPCLLY
jgi:hypothetical protein